MTYVLTDEQREAVRAALLDSDRDLCVGVGSVDGEKCTIAEIVFALTGKLSDGPRPCVSNVIRRWVIRIQDAMPNNFRNAVEWREAAIGIAGSATSDEVERKRVALLLDWMWSALGDEAVLASIPDSVRPAWDTMLRERSRTAAAAAAAAYWTRRDYAGMLRKLIEVTA